MLETINVSNFKVEIENLYFHDSEIESVSIDDNRSCELVINYYNWEGNKENSGKWEWKRLKMKFEYVAVFEWNAPDLINSHSEIYDTKYDECLESLYELEVCRKQKYLKYLSPIFDRAQNYLSITFLLNNFEEGLKEDFGYLRLIGANVSIEWLDRGFLEGQIHIPIKPD